MHVPKSGDKLIHSPLITDTKTNSCFVFRPRLHLFFSLSFQYVFPFHRAPIIPPPTTAVHYTLQIYLKDLLHWLQECDYSELLGFYDI